MFSRTRLVLIAWLILFAALYLHQGNAAGPEQGLLTIRNNVRVPITAKLMRVSNTSQAEVVTVEAGDSYTYEIGVSRCGVGKLRKFSLAAGSALIAQGRLTIWAWRSRSLGCKTKLRLRGFDNVDKTASYSVSTRQLGSNEVDIELNYVSEK